MKRTILQSKLDITRTDQINIVLFYRLNINETELPSRDKNRLILTCVDQKKYPGERK